MINLILIHIELAMILHQQAAIYISDLDRTKGQQVHTLWGKLIMIERWTRKLYHLID